MHAHLVTTVAQRRSMKHTRRSTLPPRLLSALANNTELRDWLEDELEALRRQKSELEAELVRTQRLASLGAFSNVVVHDFNNLLSAMRGGADAALGELSHEHPARADVEAIRDGIEHAAVLCRQIRLHADSTPPEVELVDLSSVATACTPLLRLLVGKNIELELDLSEELPGVAGHHVELRQVLVNLVTNAAEAQAQRGGRVCVRTFAEVGRPGEGLFAVLSVSDGGPGIRPEAQARLFEPSYSTKGKGRGVGLSAVRRIVLDHRGTIAIKSSESGTLFEIRFPAED